MGLLLLIASSRLLVWAAVNLAALFGVSDLIVGLTVVAVGTSLPELAASVAAIRRKENDLALGNIIGSNLFNTLAVVGLSGMIRPLSSPAQGLTRDLTVMTGLTLFLFVLGYGWRGRAGRISRIEGLILLALYVAYTLVLVNAVLRP